MNPENMKLLAEAVEQLERLLALRPAYGEISVKLVFHDGQCRNVEANLVTRNQRIKKE